MMNKHSNTVEENFQQRIEPLLDRAAAYAYAIVHHREDAQDVVQEAALKGFLAFGSYDPSRSFKGWWFVIIRNCCRDLLRGKRTRGSPVAIEPSDIAVSRKSHVDQQDEMRVTLGKLSEAHCEVLELRYYELLLFKESACRHSVVTRRDPHRSPTRVRKHRCL
jgi:RNA polymerase sigma-70 factor (ECF subfamily)